MSASGRRRVRLIAFARIPVPGATKTRLIPALGPEGAAALQAAMTAHTLRTASAFARGREAEIEVRYTSGDPQAALDCFPAGHALVDQGEGDLGARMLRAITAATDSGADAIVIGSDCPALSPAILNAAADALDTADVVLGPAVDGGYYLIAMRRPHPVLFDAMPWGTERVLGDTRARAREANLTVHVLPTRRDVDRPEDLEEWARFAPPQPRP